MTRRKTPPAGATGHQQVHFLRRLSQQAAAYVLGMTARALRDHPDAPRGQDGTYDAAALVAWYRRRFPLARDVATARALPDPELERVLLAAEALAAGLESETTAETIVETLGDLERRYGDGALLVFVRELLNLLAAANPPGPPKEPELLEQFQEWREREEAERAAARLQIAVVCERTGRVRCGRTWRKGPPPEGLASDN